MSAWELAKGLLIKDAIGLGIAIAIPFAAIGVFVIAAVLSEFFASLKGRR